MAGNRDKTRARVAQLVEHGSNKPRVVGSSPAPSITFLFSSSRVRKYPKNQQIDSMATVAGA